MSFDVNVLSTKPVIKAAASMQNEYTQGMEELLMNSLKLSSDYDELGNLIGSPISADQWGLSPIIGLNAHFNKFNFISEVISTRYINVKRFAIHYFPVCFGLSTPNNDWRFVGKIQFFFSFKFIMVPAAFFLEQFSISQKKMLPAILPNNVDFIVQSVSISIAKSIYCFEWFDCYASFTGLYILC